MRSMVLSFIVVKRGGCILYFNGTLIKCEALLCFMTKEKNNETVRETEKFKCSTFPVFVLILNLIAFKRNSDVATCAMARYQTIIK